MERKIGDTFEFEGKKLQVKESSSNGCDGCFFDEQHIPCSKNVAGYCEFEFRADKKEVIFVEATEQEQTEQPQEQARQPQKLNLCEILKDCPMYEPFWSPMLGDVKFHHIDHEAKRILITLKTGIQWNINPDATITFANVTSPEIMLYPSKEQRDWSKFTAPWYKKEESIKPKFKVGNRIRHKETNKDDVYEISKVYDDTYGIVGFTWMIYMKYQDQYELVPNKFDPKTLKPFDKVIFKGHGMWFCGLFSHIHNSYACVGETYYKCVIPYNDDTKHLLGTKDEAPDFYKYWED